MGAKPPTATLNHRHAVKRLKLSAQIRYYYVTESKRFSEAIITAKRGYEVATVQNDSVLAQRLARDAALYRTRTPLRRVFSSN